uniref:Glycosyltransferase 2-like domain-containing protein n=1 Tax=Alexandrium monilatum TaxID=311494 RepID=A0A7S4QIW7_9DINO
MEWWDQELFNGTGGAFHPELASKLRRPEKPSPTTWEELLEARVSVVCPTTDSRHEFHEQLWTVFEAQAWPDKELVIVETYTTRPSAFFTEKKKTDDRLVYMSFKVQPNGDWSIGLKRNICTHLASGTYMANFDDDDMYAPSYLEVMVNSLLEQKSEAITLSTYYVFDVRSGTFGWCDQRYASESTRYGYGFSYVFLRGAALCHPYPDKNMGEDFCFFNALRKRNRGTVLGGQRQVALHVDECGICCHTLHPKATSNTYAKRKVPIEEVEGLDIADLDLESYMNRFPQTQGMSRYIGKSEQREQKVTIHSTAGDFQLTLKVGDPVVEVQERLHGQMQCGGSPTEVHLHSSCPPCLQLKDGKLVVAEMQEFLAQVEDPGVEGPTSCPQSQEEVRAQAVLGSPALASTVRVGPRRAELWATLPAERWEEPDTEVIVSDMRNQDLSVSVRVHGIERLAGVRRAVIRQHGSQSEVGQRLAKEIRLAQRQEKEKGSYFEACNLSRWLLDSREFFTPGLQSLLDQVAVEQGHGLPVVRVYVADMEDAFLLVEVPLPASSHELRAVLGERLPTDVRLFPGHLQRCSGPGTPEPLGEEARLPSVVTADHLNGSVLDTIFATREMAIQAQEWCIALLSKDETQQLFDSLEAASDGNYNKYRVRMFDALYNTIYTPLLEAYGLPLDRKGVMMLSTSIQAHFSPMDYDMAQNWLQVEQLMRNQVGVKAAEASLAQIHAVWAQG